MNEGLKTNVKNKDSGLITDNTSQKHMASKIEIDDDLIIYLENLSKLRLSEQQRQSAKENIGKILRYIDKLNELDTSGEQGVSHPFSFTNFFREDIVEKSFDRTLILSNAPEQKADCFKVPKTVD